eukprot:4283304-Alexandrium_andersonii.AAC.1
MPNTSLLLNAASTSSQPAHLSRPPHVHNSERRAPWARASGTSTTCQPRGLAPARVLRENP